MYRTGTTPGSYRVKNLVPVKKGKIWNSAYTKLCFFILPNRLNCLGDTVCCWLFEEAGRALANHIVALSPFVNRCAIGYSKMLDELWPITLLLCHHLLTCVLLAIRRGWTSSGQSHCCFVTIC